MFLQDTEGLDTTTVSEQQRFPLTSFRLAVSAVAEAETILPPI